MKINSKYNIMGFLVITILLFMSVGFALYNQDLGLNGNVILKKQGKLEIVSASIVESESTNITDYSNPTIDGLNLSFKLTSSNQNSEATYLIEINNGSLLDYTFTDFPFTASTNTSDNVNITTVITDTTTNEVLNPGDVLAAGKSKIYKVKFTIVTDTTDKEINIDGNASFSSDSTGSILASITPSSGNLQGTNTITCFTLNVANTYTYNRNFTLTSSNENILLVDKSGNSLDTKKIDANSTSEYEICTMTSKNSSFLSDETSTTITLKSTGIKDVTVGELTLKVDIDVIATDKEIPTVGNVVISIPEENTTEGQATITWDRIDSGGSSITNYYIILYNSDTNTSTTYETKSSLTSYSLTNMTEGNYYAKVYGVDEAGNIGSSYCDSATTENGYCSISNTTNLKWKYTITYSLSNLQHDNSTSTTDTATIYQSYSTTLALNTTSTWYSMPSSVTIEMGGTTLTSGTDYTYDSSSGKITINKITGDVTITASANYSCLVKGTKITLANGNTKNIEDITYNDLLLVWNYETGNYTYEYPIWIEKGKTTKTYQKITFSDGTILKTVGKHGVFSKDINAFVSVSDSNNFKIGTKVAKLDKNNKIKYIKVTNIETIHEETEYYHVVSTRYYNIFANNILTTDGTVILSNLYQFGNNINWTNRNYNKLSLYDYSLFSDIMPYYMFKGLRVEEGKVLEKYLDYNTFKKYLSNNQLNKDMLLKPNTDNSGNRLWMITTSDDKLINTNNYLFKEGTYYILKKPKNGFKYWYNTADGKYYSPNDIIRVEYGMHFIAVNNKNYWIYK